MTSSPERHVRGSRVRGAVMIEWAPASHQTLGPEAASLLLNRAVVMIDDAGHDAEPRLQFHAYETGYNKPSHAMRDLYQIVARAFGCVWFSEGQPVVWYHMGGSSRLRVEVAMWCAGKLWQFCKRYAQKENLKQGINDNAEGIAFNNRTRGEWVGDFGLRCFHREVEPWVLEAWRVEKNRERQRHRDPNSFVPRSLTYEQVSRWLDDVIEASHE